MNLERGEYEEGVNVKRNIVHHCIVTVVSLFSIITYVQNISIKFVRCKDIFYFLKGE